MTRDEPKPVILANNPHYGLVFEGDVYCIKHQELMTAGLDPLGELTCPYCEWGDD